MRHAGVNIMERTALPRALWGGVTTGAELGLHFSLQGEKLLRGHRVVH